MIDTSTLPIASCSFRDKSSRFHRRLIVSSYDEKLSTKLRTVQILLVDNFHRAVLTYST